MSVQNTGNPVNEQMLQALETSWEDPAQKATIEEFMARKVR
jgi:hypothetical protein